MGIAKKLKYTLDSVNDIIDALESHGYNMANYVLGDYGNLIRQLSAKVTNGGTTGMKFIPITTKLVPTVYILDTIKAVSVEDYSFMQELNRNYLYSGTDIFEVPTNYAQDAIEVVTVSKHDFMQETNRNYLYGVDAYAIEPHFSPSASIQAVEVTLIENIE